MKEQVAKEFLKMQCQSVTHGENPFHGKKRKKWNNSAAESVIEYSESGNVKQQNKQKNADVTLRVVEESQEEDKEDKQEQHLSERSERRMREKKKKHKEKHNDIQTDKDFSGTQLYSKRKHKKKHKDNVKGYESVYAQHKEKDGENVWENGKLATRQPESKKVKHKKKHKDHEITEGLTERHSMENEEYEDEELENARKKHKKKKKHREEIEMTGNISESTETKKVKHKKKHRKDLERCEGVNVQKDEVSEASENIKHKEYREELGLSTVKSNKKSKHDLHITGEIITLSGHQMKNVKKKNKHNTAEDGEDEESGKVVYKKKHKDCITLDGGGEEEGVKVKHKKKKHHCKELETETVKQQLDFTKLENAMHKKKRKHCLMVEDKNGNEKREKKQKRGINESESKNVYEEESKDEWSYNVRHKKRHACLDMFEDDRVKDKQKHEVFENDNEKHKKKKQKHDVEILEYLNGSGKQKNKKQHRQNSEQCAVIGANQSCESEDDEYIYERHKKKRKHHREGSENVKVKRKKKHKQVLEESRGTHWKQREHDEDHRTDGDVTVQHEMVLTAVNAKRKKRRRKHDRDKDEQISQEATNLCSDSPTSQGVIDLTETIDLSDAEQAEELQEGSRRKRRKHNHPQNEDNNCHNDRNGTLHYPGGIAEKMDGKQNRMIDMEETSSQEDETEIQILSGSRNSAGTTCDLLSQSETSQQKQVDDYTWTVSEEEQLRKNWENYLQNHPFDEPDHLLMVPEDMPVERKRSIWKILRETNLLESLAHGINKPLCIVQDKARSMFVQKTSASQKGSTLSIWSPTEIKQLERNWEQFFMDHPMDNPYELLAPLHLLNKERHKWLIKFKKQTSFMDRLRQGINRSALSVYHKAKRHFCPYTELTGSLSQDEILQLKKLITIHGNKLLLISTLMGRSPTCIEFHFNQLKRQGKNYLTGKWSAEEKQRLVDAVQEQVGFDITDKENCHDKMRFSQLDWCAIAEKVQTRDMYQCFHKWMYTDCIQNYRKPSDDSQEKLLLKLIEEQNVEEARDIDWLAIYEQMKIMPSPNSVKRLFWKMCYRIPNREKKTHKEMMAILQRIYRRGSAKPLIVSYL